MTLQICHSDKSDMKSQIWQLDKKPGIEKNSKRVSQKKDKI